MTANEPEWMRLAQELVLAVAFQRGTRGVHVVGKDGRVRMGCVDLLGCYAVDNAARELCAAMGMEFPGSLPPPDERTAMKMLAAGETWKDWINDQPSLANASQSTQKAV